MIQRSVLIVEDDAPLAAMLSEALRAEGLRITQAHDGLHGLQLIASGGAPDLILLDMHMEGFSGWDFGAEFKQLALRTPIVVITADTDPERCAEAVGARAYLAKPLNLKTLFLTIEGLMGDPHGGT